MLKEPETPIEPEQIIVARELCKAYQIEDAKVNVLNGINLDIKRAGLLLFIGPSGAMVKLPY